MPRTIEVASKTPLATLKILTRCGLPSPGWAVAPTPATRGSSAASRGRTGPARSVVVRYLHRVTRTMPLKQSRSAGEGLERLCRARSQARSGAPTGRRRRVVPVVVRQRGLQKHRHDTYAVGVSDSGVQVLDCRGSVRVEDGPHQVGALSILGEVVTRFGRVLAVNCTQRAPTRPKEMPSAGELNDRSHWGSLGDVAASTSLITQRSSVQIRPPQPRAPRG